MQSQWLYLCFWDKFFIGVYTNLTRRFLHPEIPRWRTDTGSSYNLATENDIKVISGAAAMFYKAGPIHFPSVDNIRPRRTHKVQTGSRN